MQYEKALDFSTIAVDKPLPKPTVGWGTDGKLAFKAAGMPDKRNNKLWDNEYYSLNAYYNKDGNKTGSANYGTKTGTVSYANETNGKMDMSFSYWPADGGAYTVPVYVKTQGHIQVKPNGTNAVTYDQPEAGSVLVKPYTRPMKVWVDYDQWNMKATIHWSRQEKAAGYDGSRAQSVECLTDGQWYVVRYETTQGVANYEVVKDISGKSTSLQVVDDKIDYDKKYTYRVIFLPDILKSGYKDRLASLPGQSASHSTYDLWEQVELQTTFSAPVKLSHDKSETEKIHLTWEYNIPLSGLKWSVESRSAGSSNSWTEEQQLSLDPNKHTAEVRLAGSACDPKEYRVSAMINNRQVCSDILGASLPSSTYISDVQVTTGTEEQKVVVRWKVESPDTEHDIYYRVLRRIVGETDWVTLSSSTHGTFNEYEYTDDRPQAGTYYEYAVQAFGALCDEQLKQSDMIVKPGFAQARGTITGHIAFGSGTAVQGVRVSLVRATAEQEGDRAQYFSRYIEDEGTGLLWQGDPATYAGLLNGKQPLTLQLWAKPAGDGSSQMSLVTLNGALQLGVKRVGTGYCLFAADLSGGNPANYTVKEYPALTFSDYDFTHVTAVYDGQKQWTFYVGTDSLLTGSLTVANNNWKAIPAAGTNTLAVGGSNQAVAGTYKGFVDDIRLWTRALKSADVESNYTRILGGTEDGLRLYWPLDEGEQVRQYAFDIACQDGIYQLNHPEVGANAVPRREVPRLLTLYGMTDSEGDYIIKGIPFQQGGTNYKIVPELGIHEFSPGTRSMFVSPTSLTANNIDFEDVSCFPMEGYIYYAGTNIPVEGAMFYVDGMVQSREGQLIRTDETGYYSMSVPIGKHYVEARLDGHTMVDGGRFPLKDTYDFNGSVTHDFSDATLVNFVGRVGGGERNDTLAVGFGKSKNNIGMATIMLRLNNEKLMFNCQDDHLTSATTQRVWQSDTTAVNSRSWTGTGADAKYITIRTDSLTGEFSALLPPLKYIVKSVAIPSNSDIEFTTLPEVDLTNPQNELADTLVQVGSSGAEEKVPYHYVAKKVFTHFAQPQLDVTEYANGQPNAKGVYGIKDIDIPQATGETLKVRNLWTVEDNNVSYLLDYPVYNMNETVEYHFFAYEAYYNRDASTEVADIIPLDGQQLTIANEMSAEQSVVCTVDDESSGYKAGDVYELKTNKLDMDYNGEGILRWKVGKPNISSPYTRHFGISLQKDGRTHNVGGVDAIVLGALPVGSNFVTKGPDEVKFVLRDPPGAKSKTTLTKGKVTTTSKMNTKLDYGDTQILNNVISGGSLTSATGVGFMVITEQEIKNQFDWGTHVEWEEDYTSGESTVTTTFEEISTSDEAPYIGPDGDVFVGTSTNFLVGTCRQLLIKQDPTTKKYALALEEALSLDQKVSTAFRYSQYEIENVMIPKWEDMRRSYLQRVSSQGEAEGYAGSDGKTAYLTWIDQTDPNYGKEGTYYWYRPPKQEESEVDSVMWCTNQINSWKSVLAKNEKQKVEAIRGGNLENYSIDGGSSYTYSLRNEHIEVNDTVKTWRMGLLLGEHFGFKASAAIAAGMIVNIDFEAGGGEASQNTTETNNFSEWTYVLNDGNVDADLSINVFKSSDKSASDIFYLYGGQTYNPYEGAEVTHYYEPGTALGNATEQMEQPMLSISSGGNTPSKNITLTDIPAGQEANLTLHCTNMARVHQGTDFSYDVVVVESANKNGLQILMDGVPISGRSILLPQSETVTKQITIRQTDQSLLDYEGIKLRFCSQYEPEDIYDEVTLNAHFKPSSSPIDLAIQEPVLNNDREDGILDMKLTNFNRQFKNLKNVGVQYRFQGNTQWTDLFTWWVNPTDTIGRDTVSNALLPESGDLLYAAKMKSNLSFPEGDYQFRAFTTTPYGTELVSVYSDVITVIKDMSSPRSLYTPAPANGILSYGDQLAIEFNEDIVPGYVGDDNVIVTAKLNNSEVNHDVAYQIIPFFDMPRTVNPVFLKGDFAMDFWLNWHDPGTILHQGAGTDNFALGIDDAGHVKVTIAKAQFVSTDTVPKDEWVFFALSYNAAKMTFDILAQYGTTTVDLFENEPVTAENKQVVNYASDNHLYLGYIWADMHGLSLYNICHDVHEAAATKYQAKDNYIYGLANYWPMDEGHGSVAADTRHTHDFTVYDSWTLNNRNYSLRINKPEGAQADITRVGTGQGDSYAIEMWYNKSGAKDEVVFETATPTVDGDLLADESKLRLRYDSVQSIVLDYGKKSIVVASHEDFPDLRRWHHVALNVVRGQAASFYLDGQRTAVIAERDVPPIEGSRLIVGKGNEIQAFADEVRIWHAALSESRLLRNIYNTIDTADV
ncbi:MAG: hypothetical protein IKI19_04380, partial [Prevotella sp.]|nr:hypothetical protein [Prevotella sp.]